jgi:hypothetical protein
VQVFLAYTRLDRNRLLASMLAVAIFSAALAIMYFMHAGTPQLFLVAHSSHDLCLVNDEHDLVGQFPLASHAAVLMPHSGSKDSGDERQTNFAQLSAPRRGNPSPACSAAACFGPGLRSVRQPGCAGREPLR